MCDAIAGFTHTVDIAALRVHDQALRELAHIRMWSRAWAVVACIVTCMNSHPSSILFVADDVVWSRCSAHTHSDTHTHACMHVETMLHSCRMSYRMCARLLLSSLYIMSCCGPEETEETLLSAQGSNTQQRTHAHTHAHTHTQTQTQT